MKRVCVFCGSNDGARPKYAAAAKELGTALAESSVGLVYGGTNVGLMCRVADAALDSGGEVIGVIPEVIAEKRIVHNGLSELRLVASMDERKALMEKLSDAFIALPGGLGTMDEIFEMITWAQLGFHRKPCGLLNVRGYYDKMMAFLDHAVTEGFIKRVHLAPLIVDERPVVLLRKLCDY